MLFKFRLFILYTVVQLANDYAVMYADGQGTASNDQLVIAEHEILDGCPETGL